jgi:hypothetical protein
MHKGQDQLLENDFNKRVMDINEIKVEGIGSFMKKITSKKKMNILIWQDILNFTKNWKVDQDIITKIHSNYRDKKKMSDSINITKSFYSVAQTR